MIVPSLITKFPFTFKVPLPTFIVCILSAVQIPVIFPLVVKEPPDPILIVTACVLPNSIFFTVRAELI